MTFYTVSKSGKSLRTLRTVMKRNPSTKFVKRSGNKRETFCQKKRTNIGNNKS